MVKEISIARYCRNHGPSDPRLQLAQSGCRRRLTGKYWCDYTGGRGVGFKSHKPAMERSANPMKDFAGKIAVITGGGTGMGRELARQLVAEGCNVAMCDVSAEAMAETKRLCEVERLPQGLRITTHVADVSIEDQLIALSRRARRAAGDRQDPPVVQQRRHRRRRQPVHRHAASSGRGPSTSAGAGSISASAPSCRC